MQIQGGDAPVFDESAGISGNMHPESQFPHLSVRLPTLCDAHKHFMGTRLPRRIQKEEEWEIKIKHEMESDDESTFP